MGTAFSQCSLSTTFATMKRSPEEMQTLVREYQKNLSEASIPFWMDVPDILDILDHFEQTQQTIEAELCLRIALRMHPDDADILMRKVYRLKNDGRWHDAEALAKQLPDQDHIDVQFFLAEKALSEVRFFDADAIYENILSREQQAIEEELLENPEQTASLDDLRMEIAELFLDYGSEVFAKKYLLLIDKNSPLQRRVSLLQGEILMRYGSPEQAEEEVERVIDEDPYNIDAWIFRAELANERKDFDKCSEAAEYALAIEPNHQKALRMKAISALGKEDWDTVIDTYDLYHTLEPNDYTISLSVGEIYLNRQNIAKGREALQHAIQNCNNENPDKQRITHDLAVSFAMEGDIRQAYVCMATLSSLGVPHDEMIFQTARIAFNYGFIPFGIEIMRHRFSLVPGSDERNVQVAQLFYECKLYKEVQDLWEYLFKAGFSSESEAQVYLAYAAVQLRNKEVFSTTSAAALRHQPSLMQQVLGQLYKDVPLHEIPTRILTDYFSNIP